MHVTWRFREYNLFHEILKFCENINILRNVGTSVFDHIFSKLDISRNNLPYLTWGGQA